MKKPSETRDSAADKRESAGGERDDVADKRDRDADLRDRAGQVRDDELDICDLAGQARDGAGHERDHAGEVRDHMAGLRDSAAEQRDRTAVELESRNRIRSPNRVLRSELARREATSDREAAFQDRTASAQERTEAQLDRGAALADRHAGARQRTLAEADRNTASSDRDAGASERANAHLDRSSSHFDREMSAVDREHAAIDPLTGVILRGPGFLALNRDISRARRTKTQLVVGFIDVDHLKTVNDGQGHAAGDQMLLNVVNTLRSRLRASDLIFRYGGDDFICVLPESDMAFGELRLAQVNEELARGPSPSSVTVGFAELRPEDSSEDLVARADAELYRKRALR
ncbi:sensor domain-containing diguanylate cyclase [Haliea sp.]